jgi:hypothetical protein
MPLLPRFVTSLDSHENRKSLSARMPLQRGDDEGRFRQRWRD